MVQGVNEADIQVEGRRWHYYTSGATDAPVLLMVHGFRSSARFFRPTLRAFSDRWRVVAPDLPGHGDSEPWDPEEDVVEQWALLEGFLVALSLESMAVLGNSR
ncbi:MAG: alpha/beta fold hydrolase, partial [Thermoplasmata archaeon]|nr:alpha/beta fold hydrolase [Thermoplasmata archaeon]